MKNAKILLLTAALIFLTGAVNAATVSLDYAASGSANPTIVNAPTGVNGDFSVRRCCGDPLIFNATEEYYTWSYNLSDDLDYSLADLTQIQSASINLTFRTGGDTPADDWFQIDGNVTTPFGFASNHQTYNRTFNLISLLGNSLFETLASDGTLIFRTSNDVMPYQANLTIVATQVPVPASALFMFSSVIALISGRKLKQLVY